MARLGPSPRMQQRRAALLPLLERALRLTDPLLQLVDRGRVGRSMRRRDSFSACSVASSSPSAVSSRSQNASFFSATCTRAERAASRPDTARASRAAA